tara:strand:- start:578 stop:850 length:273 start_codon:yes stop_codon:yes gene_type:complete
MHDESLGQAIVMYMFNNDDMYRRHFIPTEQYMRQNPRNYTRVQELVDNLCMKFAKENKMPYTMITPEVKKQVAIDVYKEMINDENYRSRT